MSQLTDDQIILLRRAYNLNRDITRAEVLEVFPEMLSHLYDLTKPMKLIDLSWMKCIYGGKYEYDKDTKMFNKLHDVDLVNNKAQFNWDNKRFETKLYFFAPNI